MRGLDRYVRILQLFGDGGRHGWTIADISAALDVPVSTLYRTIKDMLAQHLLEVTGTGVYRLGAFFVEYDRLVRLSDPFQRLGGELLKDLVSQAQIPCVAVLARLYNDTVMCVADMSSAGDQVETSYQRGRPRPLTAGATSKVILAQLTARQFDRMAPGEMHALPPERLRALRAELIAVRKRGYAVTYGEVDDGAAGIAAPVAVPDCSIVGSLSLVVEARRLTPAIEARLVLLVVSSASLLTEQIRGSGSDRTSR